MARVLRGMLDAAGMRIVVVASRFNEIVTQRLVTGAQDCLSRHGASADSITVVWVPGSWELPQAARKVADWGEVDAIVALGVLIRGETSHFDVLASSVTKSLSDMALKSGIPIGFGLLTTETVEQAMDRAGAKAGNKGWDAALAAIEMVSLSRQMARPVQEGR